MTTVQASSSIQLGELLVERKILSAAQLELALREQKATSEPLGQILIRWGYVRRDDLRDMMALLHPDDVIDEVNHSIPISELLQTQTIVLSGNGNMIYLATLADRPYETLDYLKKFERDGQVFQIKTCRQEIIEEGLAKLKKEEQAVQVSDQKDDVNSVIQAIMNRAVTLKASDIHIYSNGYSLHVRYRIDGILRTAIIFPQEVANRLVSRIKSLASMDVSEKLRPQDGSFQYNFKGDYYDCRVASLPLTVSSGLSVDDGVLFHEKITIRLLNKERIFQDIRTIGLTNLSDWLGVTSHTKGMVLVCGPTGSGKTTTLYSTLNCLDKLGRAIYTIEDPVEYEVPFVFQTQVNERSNLTYETYLRTLLRHDPDVVVVGEIRDSISAEAAIHIAHTGHFVFATLHTNAVLETILRLSGLGIDQGKLAFILRGILVLQLVRTICPCCKGAGCESCLGSGYLGRTLLSEFARLDKPEDISLLFDHKLPYHTFTDDISYKLTAGITDGPEITRVMGKCVPGEYCGNCSLNSSCRSREEI